ncbi:MAG: hypothetical protein FWF80_09030 [Defluviitaleaceae bacterium]|nr:hypothetical protein [Defluviitaleaceae bacterium]
MNKDARKRQDEMYVKYPFIPEIFEKMSKHRRDEIIAEMLMSDEKYKELTRVRADTSQIVMDTFIGLGREDSFEAYSDAIYAEENYALDALYKEAFLDAVELFEKLKF